MPEDGEFVSFHEFAGALDAGEFVVGIKSGAGVAGKVFAATQDSGGAQGVVECGGFLVDLGGGAAIAAAAQGIVGFVIEGNVEHGAEVEIESENPEDATGEIAVELDEIEVAFVAELLGIWWLAAEKLEAGDAAAFLVDGDDGLGVAQVAKVIDEFAKLGGGCDIATE
jgi:hypothetical protein